MRQFLMILTVLWCGMFSVQTAWADMPGLETASGPEELLKLEREGAVTVRALRAFGLLPEEYMRLAQSLRQAADLDLLTADAAQVLVWSQDPALAAHAEKLESLAGFMESGDYLTWTPVGKGGDFPPGTLIRQAGSRWMQPLADAPAAQTQTAEPVEPVVSPTPAPVETAPSAGAEAGPDDGLEYPINYQLLGTYKAKLRVEGLKPAMPSDHYFATVLSRMLPEDPEVLAREKEHFRDIEENLPYNRFLGYATLDTPVVIYIDAPDNPEFHLTEEQKKMKASYKVEGRSVAYFLANAVSGDANLKEENGRISWTPHLDPDSDRPAGPRSLGIYMEYEIDSYAGGTHNLGRLGGKKHRIGWVVVAMPGDLYEHAGALYAVGQSEPVAGAGAKPNWNWPVPALKTLDVTLPEKTLKERAVKASEDMRHLAWIEFGEKKQRVVLNGQPGKWYDSIWKSGMELSKQGESFYFRGQMGDAKIAVCNGVELPFFKDIAFEEISPDGKHILVGGQTPDGRSKVFLDGVLVRETSNWLGSWDCALAANGTAFWVEGGTNDQGQEWQRVVSSDGVEGPEYKKILTGLGTIKLTLAGSEEDFYYSGEKEDGRIVVVRNGQELPVPMKFGTDFSASVGGASYAYPAPCGDGKQCMIVNGQNGPEFDGLNRAVFDQAGTRSAYTGYRGVWNNQFLVVDGVEFSHVYQTPCQIRGVTLSRDGKRWAAVFIWGAENQEEYAILAEGQELYRSKGTARNIAFSPDGSRVAWLEKKDERERVLLDGQTGPDAREIFSGTPLQFSPDGRHLVYFYIGEDRNMRIAVFGGEERMHENIPPQAFFTEAGAEYIAMDGNRMRREVLPLK